MMFARRTLTVLTAVAFALSIAGEADAARKKKRRAAKPKPAPVKAEPAAWETVTREGPGGRICFAAAEPKAKFPASYPHGAVFFMVSSWKVGGPYGQPSLSVGYTLSAQTQPTAVVESSRGSSPSVRFYVDNKEAFLERADQEGAIISSMRAGRTLRVEAVGADNVQTSYQFSLSGFTAAWDAAALACA